MRFSDIPFRPSRSTLRQFAGLLLLFGLVWTGMARFANEFSSPGAVLALILVFAGGVGLVWPPSLRWLFVGWLIAVFPLGWVLSQLVLLMVFVLIFTPMGWLGRLVGRNPLDLGGFGKGHPPPWMESPGPVDPKRYLRQY